MNMQYLMQTAKVLGIYIDNEKQNFCEILVRFVARFVVMSSLLRRYPNAQCKVVVFLL